MNRRQKRKLFKKALTKCLPDNISIDLGGLFWKKCKTIKKGLVFEHTFSMLPELAEMELTND